MRPLLTIMTMLAIVAVAQVAVALDPNDCPAVAPYGLGCGVTMDGIELNDADCDGVPDFSDSQDCNGDGEPDGYAIDNCPIHPNGDCDLSPDYCNIDGVIEPGTGQPMTEIEELGGHQTDWDGNGVGDACDDFDGDGIEDYRDNCRTSANADQDLRACIDTDSDTIEDYIDNCPVRYNPTQQNSDTDEFGDACDNCRLLDNPEQRSSDCPTNRGGGFIPNETPTPNPNQGIAFDPGPDQVQGNGGCMAVPGSAPNAPLLILVLAWGLGVIRRRF